MLVSKIGTPYIFHIYVPPECPFFDDFLSLATWKMAIYSQYALQILSLAK